MNLFKTTYTFNPGDPVWFVHDNEISKGVISSIRIYFETKGLSSRGYNVREFFNRLLPVPLRDKKFEGSVRYSIDLLNYKEETFKSCPHYRYEGDNTLFKTKEDLINSLKNNK